MIFISLEQTQISRLFNLGCGTGPRELRSDLLQQTFAGGDALLLHVEPVTLPPENVRLHLPLEVGPERSLLLPILLQSLHLVLVVLHLAHGRAAFGTYDSSASGVWHVPGHEGTRGL